MSQNYPGSEYLGESQYEQYPGDEQYLEDPNQQYITDESYQQYATDPSQQYLEDPNQYMADPQYASNQHYEDNADPNYAVDSQQYRPIETEQFVEPSTQANKELQNVTSAANVQNLVENSQDSNSNKETK